VSSPAGIPQVTVLDAYRYHPDAAPVGDISNTSGGADSFLSSIIEPLLNPNNGFFSSTIIVVTFDEGGGFFDHVPPKMAPSVANFIDRTTGLGPDNNNQVPQGFRVPAIIISPYAAKAYQTPPNYEHSSVLKLIEWAFTYGSIPKETFPDGTQGVVHRDDPSYASIANLGCALDFTWANFVQNGSFETYAAAGAAVPRWVSDHSTRALLDTAHPHTGRRDAICTTNGTDCGIHQIVTAPRRGLQSYTLTFNAVAAAHKLDGRVGADAAGTVSMPVIADGTYHPYTMTVTALGGTQIRVWMYAGTQPGWVAIDDVRLAPQ
jgi:hypothetical protein